MCGIFGYMGKEGAVNTIVEGLQKLEYRGYDSAGIAVALPNGRIEAIKQVGYVSGLVQSLGERFPKATVGIGHTRWATHGALTEVNAHPHWDCTGTLAVVHNGIVENFVNLRRLLKEGAHKLVSDTDSEVIVHLLEDQINQGMTLEKGVMRLGKLLQGSNVILVLSTRGNPSIVALKQGHAGGLAIGYGENQIFISSDIPAMPPVARNGVFLENGEIVVVKESDRGPSDSFYNSLVGKQIEKPVLEFSNRSCGAVTGQYQHFMLKEVMEQPQVLVDNLSGRVDLASGSLDLSSELGLINEEMDSVSRVVLTGCGTSFHAAMVGKDYKTMPLGRFIVPCVLAIMTALAEVGRLKERR